MNKWGLWKAIGWTGFAFESEFESESESEFGRGSA